MSRWCQVSVLGPDGSPLATWPVGGPDHADLSTVEALARLVLTARRQGYNVALTDICPELLALLDLVGLRRQVVGQTEDGKDPLGVEEAVEADDPAL
jgi:hypothetical protein